MQFLHVAAAGVELFVGVIIPAVWGVRAVEREACLSFEPQVGADTREDGVEPVEPLHAPGSDRCLEDLGDHVGAAVFFDFVTAPISPLGEILAVAVSPSLSTTRRS